VYHVAGYVNGIAINFMVDTGASVSLVHADIWKEIMHCRVWLRLPSLALEAYWGGG